MNRCSFAIYCKWLFSLFCISLPDFICEMLLFIENSFPTLDFSFFTLKNPTVLYPK